RNHNEATERVGRVLASELPESVKTYRIVEHNSNVPMLETDIDADNFKSKARYEGLQPDLSETYISRDPSHTTIANFQPNNPSRILFNARTFWNSSFGGPENFYIYEGGAVLGTGYAFNPNYALKTNAKITLIDNYNEFNYLEDNQNTSLPRVRTLVRRYVRRSKVRMRDLYGHWFDQIGSDTYAQFYAGYLESMFGGVGTEVLYRPVGSNIAYGIDLNYVKQRSYKNDFGFLDYNTWTGHVSVYWKPEFLPNVEVSVSVGQFLAGDKGVNISFARRFESGIVVGAFAAFTNVSSK
ncbi:polysaccharide biosynthesis protein, partial [Achromatium sp. WMS3]